MLKNVRRQNKKRIGSMMTGLFPRNCRQPAVASPVAGSRGQIWRLAAHVFAVAISGGSLLLAFQSILRLRGNRFKKNLLKPFKKTDDRNWKKIYKLRIVKTWYGDLKWPTVNENRFNESGKSTDATNLSFPQMTPKFSRISISNKYLAQMRGKCGFQ